ncbi:transposase [Burkholderia pseudomallei]|nr:transposase [Burkholderia pseudomallei]
MALFVGGRSRLERVRRKACRFDSGPGHHTRECLAIEVDTSLPGLRVQQVLARLKEMRGLPASITVDNGPEFAGKVLDAWAYEAGVTLSFIRPGKPVENAYIECFNGRFRDECLNEHWFVSMRHAKQLIEEWRIEYNTERPHSSLGYLTPAQFARAHDAKQQFLTSDSNCSSD